MKKIALQSSMCSRFDYFDSINELSPSSAICYRRLIYIFVPMQRAISLYNRIYILLLLYTQYVYIPMYVLLRGSFKIELQSLNYRRVEELLSCI